MKIDAELKIVRGMRDIFAHQSITWLEIEECLRNHFEKFGYKNIRTPVLEKTQLFVRSVGQGTDIVDKEIFHFIDQGGDELCLRPELTASIVRALVESGNIRSLPIKAWSIAPAFRRERPQKGRYRQFHQADVEVFGIESEAIETELILLSKQIFEALGLQKLRLEINTLGDTNDRKRYQKALNDYFKIHFDELDEDSKKRVNKNPLRILDSKNRVMKTLINNAPKMNQFISQDAKNHFENWQKNLHQLGIDFEINENLVRGLDYYNRSVFEWICEDTELGSGTSICGGGRYDYLVSEICGNRQEKVPAIGFAIGLDRLVLLIEKMRSNQPPNEKIAKNKRKKIFIINSQPNHSQSSLLSLKLLNQLTNHRADLITENFISNKKINKQFEKALQSQADIIITLFDIKTMDELKEQGLLIKDINTNLTEKIAFNQLLDWLNQKYQKKN